MGIWDRILVALEQCNDLENTYGDSDPNEHHCLKYVGRGYRGRHYEEQPPANVQYEQLGEDTTYWYNEDEE